MTNPESKHFIAKIARLANELLTQTTCVAECSYTTVPDVMHPQLCRLQRFASAQLPERCMWQDPSLSTIIGAETFKHEQRNEREVSICQGPCYLCLFVLRLVFVTEVYWWRHRVSELRWAGIFVTW